MWRCGAFLAFLGLCGCASTPPAPSPSVLVNWNAVTQLSDGASLNDLSGYLITYGPVGGTTLTETVAAPPLTLTLAPGEWNFTVQALSPTFGTGLPASITYTAP